MLEGARDYGMIYRERVPGFCMSEDFTPETFECKDMSEFWYQPLILKWTKKDNFIGLFLSTKNQREGKPSHLVSAELWNPLGEYESWVIGFVDEIIGLPIYSNDQSRVRKAWKLRITEK